MAVAVVVVVVMVVLCIMKNCRLYPFESILGGGGRGELSRIDRYLGTYL